METLVITEPRKLKELPTAKLVVLAVVAKKLVVVALVVVELPVIKRLPSIVEEALETKRPPVKVRSDEVAWPP